LAVVEELLRDKHHVTVYDNAQGHRESVTPAAEFVHAELFDGDRLKSALRQRRIEAVIHLAANSPVGESVEHPAKYYGCSISRRI
jgi:UDP-glucose 4-epimerase